MIDLSLKSLLIESLRLLSHIEVIKNKTFIFVINEYSQIVCSIASNQQQIDITFDIIVRDLLSSPKIQLNQQILLSNGIECLHKSKKVQLTRDIFQTVRKDGPNALTGSDFDVKAKANLSKGRLFISPSQGRFITNKTS